MIYKQTLSCLFVFISQDELMLKREEVESQEVGKDFWDDLKSMMGCADGRRECYICGVKEPKRSRNNEEKGMEKCENCKCDFCTVRYYPLLICSPFP